MPVDVVQLEEQREEVVPAGAVQLEKQQEEVVPAGAVQRGAPRLLVLV